MRKHWKKFHGDESGVTAVEYTLILLATALALSAVFPSIRSKLVGILTSVVPFLA